MKKKNKEITKSLIDSDENILILFNTSVLVEVVNGRIDLNAEAQLILKNRGLDNNGKWVGFK